MPANIKPLTALRFFAAMWVVCFHYWPNLGGQAAPPMWISKGYLGVELFFVLSGFILSHVYLQSAADGSFRYPAFLWARLARIYPLHLATLIWVGAMGLAAAAAGIGMTHDVLAWDALPANLLLVHAWGFAPEAGWNHPSWSISAEWFAYLCFPLFAWAAWKLRRRPGVAVAGALVVIFTLYPAFLRLAGFPLTSATIAWGALRIVPCFAYGCAIYLMWRSGVVKTKGEAELGLIAFLAAIAVAVQLGAPDAATVAIFGGLVLALAGLSSTGSGWLSGPAVVYLGEVSYAVYMVCIPWQILYVNAAQKLLHLNDKVLPPLIWLVFFTSVVGVACIAHHVVERPARKAMRRFGDRLGAEPRGETSRDTVW